MRPERLDFRPEGPDKGGDARTNGRTNESPPVFYRTSSPSGPLPKKGFNRSPKGNMWSAIPDALLCMLVIVGDGQQGSGPKVTMSCRTQGDFSPIGFKPWGWDLSLKAEICTQGRTNKQKYPRVLQDIVPFGAAALLPITYNHQHMKQGNGFC